MSVVESISKFNYRKGDRIVPGYRLEALLGAGAFGEVWRAVGPGRVKAAIKILDLSGRPGVTERQALDRIRDIVHPNLVSIFGIWLINRDGAVVDDVASSSTFSSSTAASSATMAHETTKPDSATRMVVAMQLGSMSLFDKLAKCKAEGKAGIPKDDLLNYMRDAASGIDYLNKPIHDLGRGPVSIVHGDIKPHNLLLVGGGVQVCDYSLIRPVDDLQKTAMGGTCTPAYAAPELHVNKPCVTSDQYCLAMSYVELREGNLPFPADTRLTDLFYVKYEKRLVFSGMKPHVVEVLRRATDPDTEARFSSCSEMVEALREAEYFDNTKRHWFPPKIHLSGKAWRRILVGFLAVAALTAAGMWYYLSPQRGREKLDPLIQSGRFAEAFDEAVNYRKFGTDSRGLLFTYVLSEWKGKVAALGKERNFEEAMKVLVGSNKAKLDDEDAKNIRDARSELWEKELKADWVSFLASKSLKELLVAGDRLENLDKNYGEKDAEARANFKKWDYLLLAPIRDAYFNLASNPESFTADKLAALFSASHVSKDDRDQIIDKLRANLADFFTLDSLAYPFDTADQILKNIDEIAKRYPDVYNRLDFNLKEKKSLRLRAEFQYDVNHGKLDNALDLFEDRSKEWPEKLKDAPALAKAWYKDLSDRLLNEATIASDSKIVRDCDTFLRSFDQDPAVPDVQLIRARAAIRIGNIPNDDDWKRLAAGASGKKLLLLNQLQFICRKPASGSEESKRFLSEIAKLCNSLGIPEQEEATQLLSWEKESYDKLKAVVPEIPDPIKVLDDKIARADLSTVDDLVRDARAQIQKSGDPRQRAAWSGEFVPREKIARFALESNRGDALTAADDISNRETKEKWKQFINKVLPDPGGNVHPPTLDDILNDAIVALGNGRLEAAQEKLDEIEKQIPSPPSASGDLWQHKVDLWKSMVVLAAARPLASHLPQILAAMEKTPDAEWIPRTIKLNQVPLLCKKLAAVSHCNDERLLDKSLDLLWNLLISFGTKQKDILPILESLFPERIHLLIQEEAPAGAIPNEVRKRFETLDKIWKGIKDSIAGGSPAECNAWNTEYRIALHVNEEDNLDDALSDGMALPPKSGSYVSFVRILAFQEFRKKTGRLLPGEWTAMLNDMVDVLSPPNAPRLTAVRIERARKWAADAVRELCKPKLGADVNVFRADFPTANAAQIYAILKQLRAGGSTFTADLQTAWAFAGLYQSPPDFQPGESVLAAIDSENGQPEGQKRASEALPLLFIYLQRRLEGISADRFSPAEKTTVLGHAATFLRVFQRFRSGVFSESEAKQVIARVLDPALGLADKIQASEISNGPLQARRAELYEAAYDFTDFFSKIPWQEKSQFSDPKKRSARRAAILDSAIEAARQGLHP